MKGFFKLIFSFLGFFTAIIGALAVFDKYTNKNRIDGDYLDCTKKETETDNNE